MDQALDLHCPILMVPSDASEVLCHTHVNRLVDVLHSTVLLQSTYSAQCTQGMCSVKL